MISIRFQICVLLIVGYSILPSSTSKILIVSAFGSKGHKNFFQAVAAALAEAGHEITLLTPFPATKATKAIRDIHLPPELNAAEKLLKKSNIFEEGGGDSVVFHLFKDAPYYCSDVLAEEGVQKLKKEKFDLVILSMFFTDCFLSFVHDLKVPYAYAISANIFGPIARTAGVIEFGSLRANKLLMSKFPFSFMERFTTVILNTIMLTVDQYYLIPTFESECKNRGLCSEDFSLADMKYNASISIINSVRTLEFPAHPSMPNIVYAGGIHCSPAKPLPKDLETWVKDSGKDGFIFFSLGSAVSKPSDMSERQQQIILSVFGSLKQRVLWKWDKDTMSNLPSNVKLSKWLPQQDILGHPQLRLFISHGGLLSTQEAIYHGAPILGMPIFGDQKSNIAEAVTEGWANVLHWKDLSEESLKKAIDDCLTNINMKKIVADRSKFMKDVPMHPKEDVKFWVEYVLRHNGADHIKSPFPQMSWYVIYNVDVWTALVVILVIILWIEYKIVAFICVKCCYKERKQAPKNKQKRA